MSDDILEQQRQLVQKYQLLKMKKLERNKRDIRDEIATGAHYNPKDDTAYEYVPYPRWIHREGLPSVIVNSQQEEDALRGVKAEPAKAVSVDVKALVKAQTPEAPREKRKYTRKVEAPLPANLE